MLVSWLSLLAFCKLALSAPQVKLGGTTVIGREIQGRQNVEFFGRLPYADAPVGERRLNYPNQKVDLGIPTWNATRYGESCIQHTSHIASKDPDGVPIVESEDCLFVNIIRPANTSADAQLPVMFYVHGGAYTSGTAAQYDGTEIVMHSMERGTPVMFVNVNYRLGPLGFPVGEEVQRRHLENLGIKDIRVALEWVTANIAPFGGDNFKITAFGESAGAGILTYLYFDSDLEDLIRGAILQSGAPTTFFGQNASNFEHDWQSFVGHVPECKAADKGNTFDCLRRADIKSISEAASWSFDHASQFIPFMPVVDGPDGYYPDHPFKLYEQGHFARIPFIMGNNKDEGTFFTPTTINSSAVVFDRVLHNFTGLDSYPKPVQATVTETVIGLYPDTPALGSPFGTGNETFGLGSQYKRMASITGDMIMHAPRRAWLKALSASGVKGYGYHFTDAQPHLPANLGTPHAFDLPYLFPTFLPEGSQPRTPEQLRLASDMMDYWISFATSLDPNDKFGNANRPHWPSYTPQEQVLLQLDSKNTTVITDNFRQAGIDYLISEPIALSQHPDHA